MTSIPNVDLVFADGVPVDKADVRSLLTSTVTKPFAVAHATDYLMPANSYTYIDLADPTFNYDFSGAQGMFSLGGSHMAVLNAGLYAVNISIQPASTSSITGLIQIVAQNALVSGSMKDEGVLNNRGVISSTSSATNTERSFPSGDTTIFTKLDAGDSLVLSAYRKAFTYYDALEYSIAITYIRM